MFQGRTVYIWGECWELHFLFLGAQQSEFIILGTFLWLCILSGCWLCTPDQPSHSVPRAEFMTLGPACGCVFFQAVGYALLTTLPLVSLRQNLGFWGTFLWLCILSGCWIQRVFITHYMFDIAEMCIPAENVINDVPVCMNSGCRGSLIFKSDCCT